VEATKKKLQTRKEDQGGKKKKFRNIFPHGTIEIRIEMGGLETIRNSKRRICSFGGKIEKSATGMSWEMLGGKKGKSGLCAPVGHKRNRKESTLVNESPEKKGASTRIPLDIIIVTERDALKERYKNKGQKKKKGVLVKKKGEKRQ